jgi:hypothetical protein
MWFIPHVNPQCTYVTKLQKNQTNKKKPLEMEHGGFTLNPLNPKSMVCTFGYITCNQKVTLDLFCLFVTLTLLN